jgi:hypothetical protein
VINRRVFLEAAAIAALPTMAGASQRSNGTQENVAGGPPTALIDERYVEARSVGAHLCAQGAIVHPIPDGDITQVWLTHFGPAWRNRPVTVVGLTARPALFCLEQLALSCGLRVVFHAEHVVHREGRTSHTVLRGAHAVGVSAHDLTLAGWLWAARIAEVLVTHSKQAGYGRFGPSDAGLSPSLPPGAQLLTSWIIAAI